MSLANDLYNRYYTKYEKSNENIEEIIFLGDSIISYYQLNKYFNNDNLINRGIPGDTTVGVINRLDQIYQLKPKVVIINIGLNDIARYNDSSDLIVKRILRLRYLLETNIKDVKVYILSLTPVLKNHKISNIRYTKNRNNDIINKINDKLIIYTKIIDTNSCLKDENGNLKLEYTVDGLHLSNKGYQILTNKLISEIIELKIKE